MKLIINADDLGVSKDVNDAIIVAMELGAISSSTILANTQLIEDVSEIVRRFPAVSFGLHLNITEGVSLTNDIDLKQYGLIDEEGRFQKEIASIMFRGKPQIKVQEAVLREWKAQIQRLLDFGIVPTHFDGHHHCHAWPGLVDVTIELAKEFSIRGVRNMLTLPHDSFFSKASYLFSKGMLQVGFGDNQYTNDNRRFMRAITHNMNLISYTNKLRDNHLMTTDYFAQYSVFATHFEKYVKCEDRTIELMCHPGHHQFVDEFKMVLEKQLLKDNFIISYKELL